MVRFVPFASAAAALAVGLVQLRQGIVPLLDTVTYWSGAEAVARGDFFSTTLAPSFSNFSALEFLARHGTLPFVDFPVGYPLAAGSLGALIGVRLAMEILVLISLVAIAAGISSATRTIQGRRADLDCRREHGERVLGSVFIVGCVGALVPLTPTVRLVTQGALSEPLFCAVVLWLIIALARYRHGGSWAPIPVLVIAASLLRFLGAPLAVLAGWERYRRTGRPGTAVGWTLAAMSPAVLNMTVASAAGGGHRAGWRGVDRVDLETFVRSIGGWFDARQGDIRRTYFTNDGPSWWSWPLAILWIGLLVGATWTTWRGVRSPRVAKGDTPARSVTAHDMPAESELALTAAAIMSVGLFAGILGFDALVIADNRLMLPSGLLTVCALVWWLTHWVEFSSLHTARRNQLIFAALVLCWSVTAVRPWQGAEMFSEPRSDSPVVRAVREVTADGTSPTVTAIITNDADGVHWATGMPAAYTPMPVQPLSGEFVDEVPLYQDLPCALQQGSAVVVISNDATFSAANRDLLDAEVDRGTLVSVATATTTTYRPTVQACRVFAD